MVFHPISKSTTWQMNLAVARACIEIDKHNLLPLAGQHLAARDGHGQTRPSNAARTWLWPFVIVPVLFVVVFRIVWNQPLKHGRHISLTTRVSKLQRREGCGAFARKRCNQTLCGEIEAS